MADNFQIPNDLTDIIEIKRKDKPLRDFLVNMQNRINKLEDANVELTKRIVELGG